MNKCMILVLCQRTERCHRYNPGERDGRLDVWCFTNVKKRRLRLADHVIRHDEAANKVLLWKPDGPRRRGRPTKTLQNILEKDTNFSETNLQ